MARYIFSEWARPGDTAEQWWLARTDEVPTLTQRSVYCSAYSDLFCFNYMNYQRIRPARASAGADRDYDLVVGNMPQCEM